MFPTLGGKSIKMNLKNKYWYWTIGIPKNVCDQIVKTAATTESTKAIVGENTSRDINRFPLSKIETQKLDEVRNSHVQWVFEDWVYRELQPFLYAANTNAGWNFDMDYSEACQITTYKKGQFYDWHCDSASSPHVSKDPNYNGKVRKLSMTVQLSEPEEYKGGEFQVDYRNSKDGSPVISTVKEISSKGAIIVFPSDLFHRVRPVTKGTRISLVMWTLGKPFR